MTHPGLQRLFRNLSVASVKVSERHRSREKLSGYLQKVKLVASRSPKKSVITEEISKLEKHLAEMMNKKFDENKKHSSEYQQQVKKLQEKEAELNGKITQLNSLLAQVGKKVNEKQIKAQLGKKSDVDVLEDKLYALEAKYHELSDSPDVPASLLDSISDKISLLKEKIRELKQR